MEMNSASVEAVVKQVLESMLEGKPAVKAPVAKANTGSNEIPKTAHVAMLTALENYEVKEFPMPEVGDGDILVKVEGCGICGTDAHEFKKDPFGLIPVALGHEGTGEIVKMGKNVKVDSAGKPLKVGDKVVTCMIFKDDPDIERLIMHRQYICSGVCKCLRITDRLFDHQMYVHHKSGMSLDRCKDRNPKRKILYKHPVHHIKMQIFCSAFFAEFHLLSQHFEICRQDRRR